MSRRFALPFLAAVTLVAVGSMAQAASGSGSSSGRSGSTISNKSSTTSSTNVVTVTGNKSSSNTANHVFSTNLQGSSPKFVTRPPIPLTVKIPGKNVAGFVATKQYASDHGVKFKRGVFYRGLHHRHWSARHFHPRWRTWFWYDPSTSGWYYWYADKSCYLPVNVITNYPPQTGGSPEGSMPPNGDEVPNISGNGVPDVPNPNPEGIQ